MSEKNLNDIINKCFSNPKNSDFLGDLEMFKYILYYEISNPDEKIITTDYFPGLTIEYSIIELLNDVFIEACEMNDLWTLSYLKMGTKELKLHTDDNYIFKTCLEKDNSEIISYLIKECSFELDLECENFVKTYSFAPDSKCKKILDSFILQKKLDAALFPSGQNKLTKL